MFALFTSARKALAKGLAPLALLALAACEPGAFDLGLGGGGQRVNTSAPIPVALLVPRGGNASDNFLASELENAARLAIASAEGVQIDLRVYGTAGNAATASSQATQAVADGAKIIVGPLYAEAANAAGIAAAQADVNVLAFSNNATIAGGNVFVLGNTFDNTARRLVSYARGQGKSRIVVVHGQDLAGQLGRNAIQSAIANSGAMLAGSVDFPLSQQGVIAAIPRIRSAIQSSGADAVFMTANSAGALPLLTQLMPEQGIDPAVTQYIGLSRWDIPPQTLELPGVQGGWFALPDPAASAAFRSRYQAAYGKAPHPQAGIAFDAIAAVTALVRQGRSDALTVGALTQSAGFQGATGVFRLRPDGTNERGLAIATVRDSKTVVIDAAPRGFGGFGS